MTFSAATVTLGPQPTLSAAAPLLLQALVLGKPVAEVADLLPRLFNLCRMAQGLAAKLSLGLPTTDDPTAEIIRDHLIKLCAVLPRSFGLAPRALPRDPASLLGPDGLPSTREGLIAVDPIARMIDQEFPAGTAASAALPFPPQPLAEGAFENSAAGRQWLHPLLRDIESRNGRGPLWRYAGRLADLDAALHNRLPVPTVADGTATVPSARGTYALRLTQANGIVTGLTRRTPTDHLLAPGGALVQSLASLPEPLRHLAPQVIALHDPCVPVTVREAQHA